MRLLPASSFFSWLHREARSGRSSRRPRPVRKAWLEALESRTVLSSWSTVAPMPTARDELAAAAGSDGRIYAIFLPLRAGVSSMRKSRAVAATIF